MVGGGRGVQTRREYEKVFVCIFELPRKRNEGCSVVFGVKGTAPFFCVVGFVVENNISVFRRPVEAIEKIHDFIKPIFIRFYPRALLHMGREANNGNEMGAAHVVKNKLPAARIAIIIGEDQRDIPPVPAGCVDERLQVRQVVGVDNVDPVSVIRHT